MFLVPLLRETFRIIQYIITLVEHEVHDLDYYVLEIALSVIILELVGEGYEE